MSKGKRRSAPRLVSAIAGLAQDRDIPRDCGICKAECLSAS